MSSLVERLYLYCGYNPKHPNHVFMFGNPADKLMLEAANRLNLVELRLKEFAQAYDDLAGVRLVDTKDRLTTVKSWSEACENLVELCK